MIQVAAAVKFQRRAEGNDGGNVAFGRRLRALFLRHVEVVNVSGMMFAGIRKSGFGRWVRSKH